MQLDLTSTQREEAIKAVVMLFQQYAEAPGEQAVTQALLFCTADLMDLRRATEKADPTQNLPRLITANNPAQFHYTVVVSTQSPPVPNEDPLSFTHSNDIKAAGKQFQQAVSALKSGWVSLWDNNRRVMIGQFQNGEKQ